MSLLLNFNWLLHNNYCNYTNMDYSIDKCAQKTNK